MIEAIQVAAMDAAQSGSAASPAVQPQAKMLEVGQFAEAYSRGAGTTGGPAAVTATAQPSEGMRAVLSTFDNLNNGAERINTLSKILTSRGGEMSPSEMLQATMECHQFLFKAELTSNVANRTSDGVQQLFKQQS